MISKNLKSCLLGIWIVLISFSSLAAYTPTAPNGSVSSNAFDATVPAYIQSVPLTSSQNPLATSTNNGTLATNNFLITQSLLMSHQGGFDIGVPMMANPYFKVGANVTELLVLQWMTNIIAHGLLNADPSYPFVMVLDEGWSSTNTIGANGLVQVNTNQFPSHGLPGLTWLASTLHSNGMNLIIYIQGNVNPLPGSPDFTAQAGIGQNFEGNITNMASWCIDGFKGDWSTPYSPSNHAITINYILRMQTAFKSASNRKMFNWHDINGQFQIEPTSVTSVPPYGGGYGNQWIGALPEGTVVSFQSEYQGATDFISATAGYESMIDLNTNYYAQANSKGRWVVAREVYNNAPFPANVYIADAMCASGSPLQISGADASTSPQQWQVISNSEYIAIDQDPLYAPARFINAFNTNQQEIARALINGDRAVMLATRNLSGTPQTIGFNFSDIGLDNTKPYLVRNIDYGTNVVVTGSFSVSIGTNQMALLYRISPSPPTNIVATGFVSTELGGIPLNNGLVFDAFAGLTNSTLIPLVSRSPFAQIGVFGSLGSTWWTNSIYGAAINGNNTGPNPYSLDFGGVNAWFNSNTFTMAALTVFQPGVLASFVIQTNNNGGFQNAGWLATDSSIFFKFNGGNVFNVGNDYLDGKPHLIAYTYNAANGASVAYVDGAKIGGGTSSGGGVLLGDKNDLVFETISGSYTDGNLFLRGWVWNRVLNTNEMAQLYEQNKKLVGNTLASGNSITNAISTNAPTVISSQTLFYNADSNGAAGYYTRYVSTNLTAATSAVLQFSPGFLDTNFGVFQDISSGLPTTLLVTAKTTNSITTTMGIFTGTEAFGLIHKSP